MMERTVLLTVLLAVACGPKKAPEPVVTEPVVIEVKKTLEELVVESGSLLEDPSSRESTDAAIALLEEAAERFPDAAIAHHNLGIAKWYAGDLGGAQRSLERARGLDESVVETWTQLGRTMAARGDMAGASQLFEEAIEKFPESIALRVALIEMYRQGGDLSRAVDEAKSALKVRADSIELYNSMGLSYMDMGSLGLARFVFQKAMSAVSGAEENAYLACNLGRVYQLEGKTALARAFYDKALVLDPTLLPAQVYLSEVYMADRNYEGVVELLERTALADPNNAEVQLILGVAYRGVGRHEDSAVAYRRASELKPTDLSPWFNLGILYGDHVKDYDASLEAFQRYIQEGGAEADRAQQYIKEVERERTRAEKRRKAEEDRKKREAERAERQRLLEEAERQKAEEAERQRAEEEAALQQAAEAGTSDSAPDGADEAGSDAEAAPVPTGADEVSSPTAEPAATDSPAAEAGSPEDPPGTEADEPVNEGDGEDAGGGLWGPVDPPGGHP